MWLTQLLQKLRLRQHIVTVKPWRVRRCIITVRPWRVKQHTVTMKFWRSHLYQCGVRQSAPNQPLPQWHIATAVTCQNHLYQRKLSRLYSHLEVLNVLLKQLHMKLTVCDIGESLLGLEMGVNAGRCRWMPSASKIPGPWHVTLCHWVSSSQHFKGL